MPSRIGIDDKFIGQVLNSKLLVKSIRLIVLLVADRTLVLLEPILLEHYDYW